MLLLFLYTQAVNTARRTGQTVETSQKFGAGTNKQHGTTLNVSKLDQETEELKHAALSQDVSKLIMQGRQAKGWSQKELATVSVFPYTFILSCSCIHPFQLILSLSLISFLFSLISASTRSPKSLPTMKQGVGSRTNWSWERLSVQLVSNKTTEVWKWE